MIDPSIPQPLQDAIVQELEPDEKVVWSGMPKPRFFTRPTLYKFLFGVGITIFTVSWLVDGAVVEMLPIKHVDDLMPLVVFLFFFVVGIALAALGLPRRETLGQRARMRYLARIAAATSTSGGSPRPM